MMEKPFWQEMVDTTSKYGRLIGLMKSAKIVAEFCLAIKPGDTALIVTDTEISPLIYYTLAGAIHAAGGIPTIAIMQPSPHPSAEPPVAIAEAMRYVDIVINCCSRTLTHTKARFVAQFECKRRYFAMPALTEDTMIRGAATADFEKVKEISLKVAEVADQGKWVRVQSDFGTDVTFSIEGRPFNAYYGEALEPGTAGGFPGGEVNTLPVESTVNGTVVIDSFMMEVGLLKDPIKWKVKEGKVIDISGGKEADLLRKYLEANGDENSYYIGEFSIGTNYAARTLGIAFEDKQVYGTVHMAIGSGVNSRTSAYRAKYKSKLHLDGVMSRPTVTIDGKVLMQNGEILVAPRPY
jgi:leucyl aminopeptidase (aminopeptidase T)